MKNKILNKLVIVEDDEVQLKLLSSILEYIAIEIVTFSNVVDTCIYLDTNRDVEMVITDWHMQKKDGGHLIEFIRMKGLTRKGKPIPILVVSAFKEVKETIESCYPRIKMLDKPLTFNSIEPAIKELIKEDPKEVICNSMSHMRRDFEEVRRLLA
jgi:DNA-binding NtrC family response regulator